ncbi:MAG: hypothetical protein ABSD56_10425 [Bryobacteraceae bacterium]
MGLRLRELVLAILFSGVLSAANFTAKFVDGFRRPLPGVDIELYYYAPRQGPAPAGTRITLLKLRSDSSGIARGKYDAPTLPEGQPVWIAVYKEGYRGFAATDLLPEYVLLRDVRIEDLHRIARLAGPARRRELRQFLAGDPPDDLFELVFFYERRLRPALRSLAEDPHVGGMARALLAFIGVPADLQWLVRHAPPLSREPFGNRWAYGIATALLEPSDDEQWAFLRKCALNEYNDGWVDAGAISTLRLIASPRSVEILEQARSANTERAGFIESALKQIRSNPPVLAHPDLEEAAKTVAQAITIGRWEGNAKPRYNEQGDMALVDSEFLECRDRLTYTATFHRVDGVWKLRGVRETMQALIAVPPPERFVLPDPPILQPPDLPAASPLPQPGVVP